MPGDRGDPAAAERADVPVTEIRELTDVELSRSNHWNNGDTRG
jgi:hypothetical protein